MFRVLTASVLAIPIALAQTSVTGHPAVTGALQVLDAWISATTASREQPGLSIGIVHGPDLIWAKGYGFADTGSKSPATPATLYRIASISKTFTSTAILQLRDAGKLHLDDPVAKHLPWFKIRGAQPGDPAVTIRHLLTHSSGLPREAAGVSWTDAVMPVREDMVRNLAGQERVFPAEEQWKYSNLALSLAGEIVAAVSGEPWGRYLEDHILKPLGMTSTRPVPAPDTPGLATGYGRRVPGAARAVRAFLDIQAQRPAGNLASSVVDLARYISFHMEAGPSGGGQILKGATLREMHRVHWLHPSWRSGWGLGFSVRRVGEQVRVGHGGSLHGFRTQIEFAPADKLGVIVLTNSDDGEPMRYLNQAFNLLNPALKQAEGKRPAAPDHAWQKYTGPYWSKDFGRVEVLVVDGELTLLDVEQEEPWESRILLKPAGERTFRMTAPSLSYGAIGELLRFEVDAQGQVSRMSTPYWYWTRQRPPNL